ncbi:siderophore-interacting protein [Actinoplanes bogorensis]|uniref:Siderophore-interacting protein n=1 Tax=Paractinoplanes bogorensis TaxID=1610840 RepID=A0ABS5YU79_9ACTN|nr:siderophore-interacting protein [Actinoplanes bogorensis]MBU2667018.1 siderophore-interacting protein [Actinoplanes bogorensis]
MSFARRAPLTTKVRAVSDVTPHMRQIELVGPELRRLRCRPGAHVVVHCPERRVYSLWRHDPGVASMTLRVAVHDTGGPGCTWALGVQVGDRVTVEPPRSKITLADAAPFHLFIGDETGAVPLLAMRAAMSKSLPAYGVFESPTAADDVPGFGAFDPFPWVHRGSAPAVASAVLLRAVQDLELPARPGTAYVAGESSTCRLIQRHLIEQRGWPRTAVLVQPQWAPDRPGFGAGRTDN